MTGPHCNQFWKSSTHKLREKKRVGGWFYGRILGKLTSMKTMSQQTFMKTLPEVMIPHLPPKLQTIQVRQPWRWLYSIGFVTRIRD